MLALAQMSGGAAAVCFFVAFVCFIVAAVLAWPGVPRWSFFIATGLAFWVFVLLWAAIARA